MLFLVSLGVKLSWKERVNPSETIYALKMNVFSITSLSGTNRWPWDATRANWKLQSVESKQRTGGASLTGVVPGAAACTALREKNTGGKHQSDKLGD